MCHVDSFIVDPSVSLSKSDLLCGTFKCAKDWAREVIHQQRQQSSIAGSESFIPKTGRFCSTYEVEAAMHSHHSLHSFQEAPE